MTILKLSIFHHDFLFQKIKKESFGSTTARVDEKNSILRKKLVVTRREVYENVHKGGPQHDDAFPKSKDVRITSVRPRRNGYIFYIL
jgi:hypothetical protein